MTEPLLDHAGLEILAARRVPGAAGVDADRSDRLPRPRRADDPARSRSGCGTARVVFTTAPGSKLEAAIMNRPVAIEIDGWDAETHARVERARQGHGDDGGRRPRDRQPRPAVGHVVEPPRGAEGVGAGRRQRDHRAAHRPNGPLTALHS